MKKSILLVEDSDDISYLIEHLLKRNEYDVIHARDGKEAELIISRIAPPSLAILDLIMPYKSGREILEIIRSMSAWDSVPVIILSSLDRETDIVDCLKNGASDYITKPFNINELIARINVNILRKK